MVLDWGDFVLQRRLVIFEDVHFHNWGEGTLLAASGWGQDNANHPLLLLLHYTCVRPSRSISHVASLYSIFFSFFTAYAQPVYWVSNMSNLTLHYLRSHFSQICMFFSLICSFYNCILFFHYFTQSYSTFCVWFQHLWSFWGSLNLMFLISRTLDIMLSFLLGCVYH